MKCSKSILLILVSAITAMSSMAIAAENATSYGIRRDEPSIGSHIARRAVISTDLPFDKKYSELTDQQKSIVRSWYEKMGATDEPPFPANGLGTIYKAISQANDILKASGQLTMTVEIDEQGMAQSISIFDSPDPKLSKFATSVIMLEKFKPAICDGAPCKMAFPINIEFVKR